MARYKADPNAADQTLAIGESPRNKTLPAPEHAAWTLVCNFILNLDESSHRLGPSPSWTQHLKTKIPPPRGPKTRTRITTYTGRNFSGALRSASDTAALASLLHGQEVKGLKGHGGLPGFPNFAPKAKRVIYLTMNGGPSHLDLWDYKPKLIDHFNQDLPDTIRHGQRITTMTSGQARFPVAPSRYKFEKHDNNEDGTWVSELLPYTSKVVKDLCVIRSMYTEAINHDPATTFIQTGSQLPGRPSIGSWVSYGLGTMNEELPTYIVLRLNLELQGGRPSGVHSPLGRWIFAERASGSSPAKLRRSGSVLGQPRGRRWRNPADNA